MIVKITGYWIHLFLQMQRAATIKLSRARQDSFFFFFAVIIFQLSK